jgi:hypothetical protein
VRANYSFALVTPLLTDLIILLAEISGPSKCLAMTFASNAV